jgi:hypothetical protein
LAENFGFQAEVFEGYLFREGSNLHAIGPDIAAFPIFEEVGWIGLPVAHVRGRTPKLTTEACHLLGHLAGQRIHDLESYEDLFRFVNRNPLFTGLPDEHQVLARFKDWAIGHGIVDKSKFLSRFPRTGWCFGSQSM